MIKFYLLLLSG